MDIFPPAGNPWRTPSDGPVLVTVRTMGRGEYEVTVRPGGDVADIVAALGTLPTDAIFTEHYGDVDAVLVFRPIPEVPAIIPDHGPLAPLASAAR